MLFCLFSVKQEAWETEKSLLLHNKQFDKLTSWLVLFLHSGKEEKAKWRERRRKTRETPEGPKPCQPGGGGAGLWPHCSVLHKGLCSWGPSGCMTTVTTEAPASDEERLSRAYSSVGCESYYPSCYKLRQTTWAICLIFHGCQPPLFLLCLLELLEAVVIPLKV